MENDTPSTRKPSSECWVPPCFRHATSIADTCWWHGSHERRAARYREPATNGPGYVERLEAEYAGKRAPIVIEAPRYAHDEAGDTYGRAAMLGALDDFEAALADGEGRNNAINALAFRCGQLTRDGAIDGAKAVDMLAEVARRLLPDERGKTERTIANALRDGLRG
jgi:hypothetical protein